MMNNSPLRYLISLVFSAFVLTAVQSQSLVYAYLSTPANSGVLSEDCNGPYQLVILNNYATDDTITITLTSSGEALLGVDFNFPPGTFPLVMLPGQDSIVLNITVVNDGVPEGVSNGEESLVLELNATDGTTTNTFIVQGHAITDAYFVNLNISGDTFSTCDFGIATLALATGASWESSGFAFFRPEIVTEPGWYYLQVGSDTCGAKDSIYVNLQAGHVSEDTLFICDDGDGIQVNPEIFGEEISFTWIPADSTISDTTILTPILNPAITTTYILEVEFEACTSRDTFVVRVDSLPDDLHIDIAPLKPYYCAGEIVALFSPSYDSLAYPDITFEWTPNDNTFLSDRTLLNAALQLQDTTTYIRFNRNNACMSQDERKIDVVPAGVPLTVTDTTLCPGAQFEVTVLSNQVTDPEWTPADGLSCTMCLSPTVTVIGTPGSVVSYNFSGKIKECPVGANLLVRIPPLDLIEIDGDRIVCEGSLVPLTISNPEGLSGFQWNVISGDATLSCDNCPSPLVAVNGTGTITIAVTANTADTAFCGAIGDIQLLHGTDAVINGDPIGACEGGTAVAFPGIENIENVTWSVVSGDLTLSCTACPAPTVTIESDGELHYTGTSTHPDTCSVMGSVLVRIDSNEITLPPILLCIDSSVTLSTGLGAIGEITWDRKTGDLSLSCTDCPQPVVTLHGAGGIISFSGFTTDPDTCYFEGDVTIIATTGTDDMEFNIIVPDSGDIHQGDEVTIELQTKTGVPFAASWIINGTNVGGNSSMITFDAVQEINIITATFTNSVGCTQIFTDTIFALPPMYQIPNAFTPNGDGLNDRFRILVNGDIHIETFLIFNRWGQLVYEGPADDIEGWDGKFKGENASSDTYVYTAKLRLPDRSEIVKGDVMLIR